jgi:peroxiredoxin
VLEEGTPLPDFDTIDDRGRRITRHDLLGKWAVVWWYLKADTPG